MIELTKDETQTLNRYMAQGMSKGEALAKMGKVVRKVIDCDKEHKAKVKSTTARAPRPIDPVKDWLMGYLTVALEGTVGNSALDFSVTEVTRDATRKIDLVIGGESYTLALTKHKGKKEE